MEERIRLAVGKALAQLGVGEVSFAVEWPGELAHGDYAVNAALAASKALGKSPRDIADRLVPALQEALGADAANITVAGPGFINITLSRAVVAGEIARADREAKTWGAGSAQAGERVMVEYGNPNPFKEMHIGHLMGAIIGESVSRLIENAGATMLRDTFGGDVGPQVAKALWALRKKGVTDALSAQDIGAAYTHGATAYEENPEAKAEIDTLNTQIYDVVAKQEEGSALSQEERELLALWRGGREISMEEFQRIFAVLGTHFDYTFFDSDTTKLGMDAVRDGLASGVFAESEGAIVYQGEKKGLHTLVFITSRGTPTYETKDIGLAFLKEMRAQTDKVIIITAIEQIGHFKVALAALEDIAPTLAAKTSHVPHGLLQLTTGKMSSRKGNVITAAELIHDLIEQAAVRNSDPVVAQQVAIGALKYLVLRSAPGANVIFDPEKSLSLDGDSGPYLQYALVRAHSILEKADAPQGSLEAPSGIFDIERLLIRFPEIAARAERERSPHHVAQYLTQLAGMWNSFYAKERIVGGEHEAYKLAVARAFATTMENGLRLLGIPMPERM